MVNLLQSRDTHKYDTYLLIQQNVHCCNNLLQLLVILWLKLVNFKLYLSNPHIVITGIK